MLTNKANLFNYTVFLRCIQTIRVHSDSVWALLATETFQYVISGGRDKKVLHILVSLFQFIFDCFRL